jgi:hypothetical protein
MGRRQLIVSDLVAGGPDCRMADNKTMRAWLMDSYDGVEKLRLSDVNQAVPGPGEALVAIRFAALNPADAFLSGASGYLVAPGARSRPPQWK